MTVSCPICRAERWSKAFTAADMYTGEASEIARCRECGVLRTADDYADSALGDLYSYDGVQDAGARFSPISEGVLRRLRAIRARRFGVAGENRRALDVGCGRGAMLGALRSAGWGVVGTELDAQIAETARRDLGENCIKTGPLRELDFPEAPFDLITMWHSLEHLPHPRQDLIQLTALLAKHGRIFIAVPNAASWQAKLFGRHWLHLDAPRHRWHFSSDHVERLMGELGLRLVKTDNFSLEYGPYGMFQSALAASGLGHHLFTRMLRGGGTQFNDPRTLLHLALAGPICLAALVALATEGLAAFAGSGGAVVLEFERSHA